MNKHIAKKSIEQGLKSIEELTKLLDYVDDDSKQLKLAIAVSIETIDTKLLRLIYKKFPELNDLK